MIMISKLHEEQFSDGKKKEASTQYHNCHIQIDLKKYVFMALVDDIYFYTYTQVFVNMFRHEYPPLQTRQWILGGTLFTYTSLKVFIFGFCCQECYFYEQSFNEDYCMIYEYDGNYLYIFMHLHYDVSTNNNQVMKDFWPVWYGYDAIYYIPAIVIITS